MTNIRNNNLTRNMEFGLSGEWLVHIVLNLLGIKHEHTDWDNYAYGSGCDIHIPDYNIYIEVKNLRGDYKLTNEFVMNEIISRFPHTAKYKILAISCKSSLTRNQMAR